MNLRRIVFAVATFACVSTPSVAIAGAPVRTALAPAMWTSPFQRIEADGYRGRFATANFVEGQDTNRPVIEVWNRSKIQDDETSLQASWARFLLKLSGDDAAGYSQSVYVEPERNFADFCFVTLAACAPARYTVVRSDRAATVRVVVNDAIAARGDRLFVRTERDTESRLDDIMHFSLAAILSSVDRLSPVGGCFGPSQIYGKWDELYGALRSQDSARLVSAFSGDVDQRTAALQALLPNLVSSVFTYIDAHKEDFAECALQQFQTILADGVREFVFYISVTQTLLKLDGILDLAQSRASSGTLLATTYQPNGVDAPPDPRPPSVQRRVPLPLAAEADLRLAVSATSSSVVVGPNVDYALSNITRGSALFAEDGAAIAGLRRFAQVFLVDGGSGAVTARSISASVGELRVGGVDLPRLVRDVCTDPDRNQVVVTLYPAPVLFRGPVTLSSEEGRVQVLSPTAETSVGRGWTIVKGPPAATAGQIQTFRPRCDAVDWSRNLLYGTLTVQRLGNPPVAATSFLAAINEDGVIVRQIALSSEPLGIQVNHITRRAYVLDRSRLHVVDLDAERIVKSLPAKGTILRLASESNLIYVFGKELQVFDGAFDEYLLSTPLANPYTDVAVDGKTGRAYLADGATGALSVLDTNTGATFGPLPVAGALGTGVPPVVLPQGFGPRLAVVVDSERGRVYVSDPKTRSIVVLDGGYGGLSGGRRLLP